MTAFNAVRFRGKLGRDKEFLDAHKKVAADWPVDYYLTSITCSACSRRFRSIPVTITAQSIWLRRKRATRGQKACALRAPGRLAAHAFEGRN